MAKAKAGTDGMSKLEGVRRALAKLGKDAMPLDIQDYLKNEFQINMPTAHISNYKSTLLKHGPKNGRRKRGRKAPAKAAPASTHHAGGITLADIHAVKVLADRLGVHKLRQLANVLDK